MDVNKYPKMTEIDSDDLMHLQTCERELVHIRAIVHDAMGHLGFEDRGMYLSSMVASPEEIAYALKALLIEYASIPENVFKSLE